MDQKTEQALKEKYGRIAHLTAPDGRVIAVKKPSGPAWRAFVGRSTKDGANRETAIYDLVREHGIYPEKDGALDDEAFVAILDEFPALTLTLFGSLSELAGSGIEATIRKN